MKVIKLLLCGALLFSSAAVMTACSSKKPLSKKVVLHFPESEESQWKLVQESSVTKGDKNQEYYAPYKLYFWKNQQHLAESVSVMVTDMTHVQDYAPAKYLTKQAETYRGARGYTILNLSESELLLEQSRGRDSYMVTRYVASDSGTVTITFGRELEVLSPAERSTWIDFVNSVEINT